MKHLLLLGCLTLLAISCRNTGEVHNNSYVKAKVDSIVGSRLGEMNRRAMEDLDQRMAIEVKAKADSIIAAHHKKPENIASAHKKPSVR